MTDEKDLVTIITHLTIDERDRVKGILDSLKIPYLVSGHDSTSQHSSLYYLIKVRQRDLKTAKQIVNQHKANVFIDSRKCPKCKTLGYKEIDKKGLWEKILYYGTILVQCNKCKTKFPI